MNRSWIKVVVLVIVAVVIWGGCCRVRAVNANEDVEQKWADVQTNYQRRADLIPQLVETVRSEAKFEREVLERITRARAAATQVNINANELDDPAKMAKYNEAQKELSSGLGRLLAVAENYPNLKTNDAFRDLRTQLEGTENRINTARRDYNAAVRNYNATIKSPLNSPFISGYEPRTYFNADAGAEKAPSLNLNL